ncbi:CopG family transcriptional regulator [Methanocaldococcus villosus KIN24-T80]|uniref:CopG family transcriptional regulator n=1 Tax=Methanocaldococcus villosus KIN24-T80 TaxID=1069083 RepID=N6VZV7_9EURY|nr:CopG family ribbon-helix-helix protein [Methanocaldococcus villosus]ENN96617.1 CopG family transcriptional regulator [Methanocaldococcus villosus KIN24-T80]
MVNVERVSLSLPKFLLGEIDRLMKRKGYSSRSELIRDAIRKYILESNLPLEDKEVGGIIILVYSPNKENIEFLEKLFLEYKDIINSINQSYIKTSCGKNKKIETYIVEGNAKKILEFYENIIKIPEKIYDKIIIF